VLSPANDILLAYFYLTLIGMKIIPALINSDFTGILVFFPQGVFTVFLLVGIKNAGF